MTTKHTNWGLITAAFLLLCGLVSPASAELAAVGPVNPDNGFPLWYQDTEGLRLDLCLDQNGFCLTEEPDPTQPIAFPDNFGPEAFWWAAEAAVAGDGIDALLVLAMEAAFANEEPIEGDQVAFARIRIRIDVPVAGTYTVTHPFGVLIANVAAVDVPGGGGAPEINETQDIGNFLDPGRAGDFTAALADGPNPPLAGATVNDDGRSIGPFLTSATGNVTDPISGFVYLANPATSVQVIGSPLGTNLFSVVGPGDITAQTTLFSVMGKISVNQPATINRAEYRVKTGKFHIQGKSLAVEDEVGDPTVVTIHLGSDETGPVIGTATVDAATGIWVFEGKSALSPGGTTRTVATTSTADPTGAPQTLPLVLR